MKKNEDRSRDTGEDASLALPRLDFPSVFEGFARPFDALMQSLFPNSTEFLWSQPEGRSASFDVQDRGDHYVFTAELPGFEKKDVEVRVASDSLELKAQRQSDTENRKGGQRLWGSYFYRRFALPEEVVSEKVRGTIKNGVLELSLPKREAKPKTTTRRVDLK